MSKVTVHACTSCALPYPKMYQAVQELREQYGKDLDVRPVYCLNICRYSSFLVNRKRVVARSPADLKKQVKAAMEAQ